MDLAALRQDQRTPRTITAIIAFLFILTLWNTITDFISHHTKIVVAQTTKITPLTNVADLHIFGIYTNQTQNLPATSLQLTLDGTVVVLGAPNESLALITGPGEPTKIYHVGETLPGNATITSIAKHEVIINDDGRLEKLLLPIDKLNNNPL